MYKQIKDISGDVMNMVVRVSDLAYIPLDPDNTDFQQYQKWLSEGNQPLPADGDK